MAAIKGRLMLIKRGNGDGPPETFTAVGAFRSKSISMTHGMIDTTTEDLSDASAEIWREVLGSGVKSMSVSGSGIFKDTVEQNALITDFNAGSTITYEFEVTGVGTFSCETFIESFELSGEYDDAVQFSATFQSAGPVTWTAV